MKGVEETSQLIEATLIVSLNSFWDFLCHLLYHFHIRLGPPCVDALWFEEIICERHKPKLVLRLYLSTADIHYAMYSNSRNDVYRY